jgi:hypothetical protein
LKFLNRDDDLRRPISARYGNARRPCNTTRNLKIPNKLGSLASLEEENLRQND